MQMGILGLPKAGKTTLFNLLTASRETTDKFAKSKEAHVAIAQVPDARLVKMRDMFNPRKYVPATVQFVDVPGMQRGQGSANLDLVKLREVDALVHVVRGFEDQELPHEDGSVDPGRDVANVDLELILADLELVERRLERLKQSAKRGLKGDEKREEILLETIVQPALEAETPLREVELATEDERLLRGFQLLSAKPLLLVLNVAEADLGRAPESILGAAPGGRAAIVVISAPIEQEIAQLPAAEAAEFLSDLGLSEPSIDRVIRASYELLGRISFFTVGEDEVRAWTIRRRTTARAAAGAIHSDIERGFIRAEVVAWDLLLERGSLAACRDKGELRLEGKDYEVLDGEVVHFRFNV
jgi:GTP-binding protein YchF